MSWLLGVLLAGSVLPVRQAQAQAHWFRHYSNKDGLSNNHVNCSVQDRNGFIWFGTLDGLNRFDGYNFKVFRTGNDKSRHIGNNFVSALYVDAQGTLWIGTHNGLWRYDAALEKFDLVNFTFTEWIFDITGDDRDNLWLISLGKLVRYNIPTDTHETFELDDCLSLIRVEGSGIWVSTNNGYIANYNPQSNEIARHNVFDPGQPATSRRINKLFDTRDGHLLIGTQDQGLKSFDRATRTHTDIISRDSDGNPIAVTDIAETGPDEFWISTANGIYVYDRRTGAINHIRRDGEDTDGLADHFIQDLQVDKDGGIWLCNRYEGVNYFHRDNNLFSRVHAATARGRYARNVVGQMAPDPEGNLWIATENNGLFFLDRKRNALERRYHRYTHVTSVLEHGGELWVGNGKGGLDVLDARTGTPMARYAGLAQQPAINSTSRFNCLAKTSTMVIAGTSEGVFHYDGPSGQLQPVEGIGDVLVSSIFEDHAGGIWVGSHYSGLFYIDPETRKGRDMRLDFSDDGRYNNSVTSLVEDEDRQLWISTEGRGVCRYDRDSGELAFITTADGLPSNTTFKVLKGSGHHLWIATAAGLCRLDTRTLDVLVYTDSNGLPFDQFNYNSGYAASDGTFYFGATKGLIGFEERLVKDRDPHAALFITGIQVENRELLVDSGNVALARSILDTEGLALPHDKASFSLDIAAIAFQSPNMTQYRYMLEGLEDTWTILPTNRKIYFTKLPPGRYVFRANAAVSNGRWGDERRLIITVTPPWWQSHWAYLAYAALALLAIYWAAYLYMRKVKEKGKRLVDMLNHEKDKEIYKAKIDFFTNVAHEIRTPLTLIVAPIENIGKATAMEEVKGNLPLLQKNAQRLVALANQLLDFRKIEQNNLKLNFVKTDIGQLLDDSFQQFRLAAEAKGLRYRLLADAGKTQAYVDPEALRKVLSNLLHNATKYARSKILVALTRNDGETFTIKVMNDGPPIPDELREKLFEPFYRHGDAANVEGTGIGLAIARSLAILHSGRLEIGPGTEAIEFALTLPLHQEFGFDFEHPVEFEGPADTVPGGSGQETSILIVDDSEDILAFLQHELAGEYRVYLAQNGNAALELLNEAQIGLVVSDIVMPGMDGFELCRAIKSDINLSHIPVILLTAKNTIDAKVAGLELGADAYIEKPFSPTHVKAQITSLLQNRERVMKRFANSTGVHIGSMALSKTDDVFLNKLNDTILANLENADLDADGLADTLCMSRRNLYRKIKAVAGVSPLDMITIIRLKKAAELLRTTDLKIYEIATQTGFKSPDTFARNFSKQFGQSPTEFAKSGVV